LTGVINEFLSLHHRNDTKHKVASLVRKGDVSEVDAATMYNEIERRNMNSDPRFSFERSGAMKVDVSTTYELSVSKDEEERASSHGFAAPWSATFFKCHTSAQKIVQGPLFV
jgi:hypothetical protein